MWVVIIVIIGAIIYVSLPLPLQFIVLLLNTKIPDPIPYIDEIIMYGAFLKKLIAVARIEECLEWIEEHKLISILIGISVITVIIILVAKFV